MSDKVSSLVRRFGEFRLQKNGSELVFRCPECQKMKLSYNVAKNVFHPCWGCTWTVKLGRTVKRFIKSFEPGKKVAEDQELGQQVMPGLDEKCIAFLAKRGVQDSYSVAWGMKDGRIFIPIMENGKLMCWVARAIDEQKPKELSGPNRSHFFYGDYDNPPGTFAVLEFGIILVEGIFDQLHIREWHPCLALMGSSISDIQIGKLVKLTPSRVILMLDGDEAGRKATNTIERKLAKRMNPFIIKKVWLPDGMDPDQLTKEQFDKLMEGI